MSKGSGGGKGGNTGGKGGGGRGPSSHSGPGGNWQVAQGTRQEVGGVMDPPNSRAMRPEYMPNG